MKKMSGLNKFLIIILATGVMKFLHWYDPNWTHGQRQLIWWIAIPLYILLVFYLAISGVEKGIRVKEMQPDAQATNKWGKASKELTKFYVALLAVTVYLVETSEGFEGLAYTPLILLVMFLTPVLIFVKVVAYRSELRMGNRDKVSRSVLIHLSVIGVILLIMLLNS